MIVSRENKIPELFQTKIVMRLLEGKLANDFQYYTHNPPEIGSLSQTSADKRFPLLFLSLPIQVLISLLLIFWHLDFLILKFLEDSLWSTSQDYQMEGR